MHWSVPGGSFRPYDWRIGVWPFANGVVLAVWLALASRRIFWAGAAFVGVHLVVFVWIFFAFTTELSRSYLSWSETGLEWAAVGWAVAFGSPDDSVPWLVASCLILGVFLSGPPLVLMGVGGRSPDAAPDLARDAVPSDGRAGLAGVRDVGPCVAFRMDPFGEDQDVALEFRVVEQGTGRPIQAASVRIADALEVRHGEEEPNEVTDQDGIAGFLGRFPAEGVRNAFRTLGSFSPYGRWLESTRADRRALRSRSAPLSGWKWTWKVKGAIRATTRPGEATAGPFEDVAGDYSPARPNVYFCGRLWLEPDGRFACPVNGGHTLPVYGFLRATGRSSNPSSAASPRVVG